MVSEKKEFVRKEEPRKTENIASLKPDISDGSKPKTFVVNGVEEHFKDMEAFRARIYELKNQYVSEGKKKLVVNNMTKGGTIKPSATWDDMGDGDVLSITPVGSGAIEWMKNVFHHIVLFISKL